MLEEYQKFIDDMTHTERSVFFYHFVLKIPQREIAKRLHLSIREVSQSCKDLATCKECLWLSAEIRKACEKTEDVL